MCQADADGDLLYLGRLDYQIKIQGFRVELSEIEFHVKAFLKTINVVVVPLLDPIGNTELGLVIESNEFNTEALQDYMKSQMPLYMVPKLIKFIAVFPLNTNGKTDRKELGLTFRTK